MLETVRKRMEYIRSHPEELQRARALMFGACVVCLLGGLATMLVYAGEARYAHTTGVVYYAGMLRETPRPLFQVNYQFTVEGKRYNGGRQFEGYELALEEARARFRPGTQHRVYYDFDRPELSLLQETSPAWGLIVPVGFFAMGVCFGVIWWCFPGPQKHH